MVLRPHQSHARRGSSRGSHRGNRRSNRGRSRDGNRGRNRGNNRGGNHSGMREYPSGRVAQHGSSGHQQIAAGQQPVTITQQARQTTSQTAGNENPAPAKGTAATSPIRIKNHPRGTSLTEGVAFKNKKFMDAVLGKKCRKLKKGPKEGRMQLVWGRE
ncbi:uncharacterized protein BDR25DRAFT_316016 [Lindgomyces ingoldianus]|uniref:Uncharacterized protein n=1 Tax=Lindgomyces ingoldianus TaxID=673940 RepID=A0ACB6QNF6_9PLEO|nr:uncharacterized protein BDR25DRAFT_316016 [Lindgomyces ingoldianus]KAF2468539.1 hypothetical protein BDR25DRAFT_316016 [Lindgomyces ingoldianus]